MEPVVIVVAVSAVALWLGALAFALTQIAKHEDLNSIEKTVWVVAVLMFPLGGSVVWYAAGPHPFGLRIQAGLR
ncbi:PLDc N-terminal domain-containing protein [Agromyces archimandritae]|uniref:PLDc N-terminal domain-containing protein n=1 Tax=Agromyces archimandritae TaxID=2781962 RepID=A0A975FKI0_9MICO|nr:PLDc N-terminal domain-containing protein [Agromyces archimandritae]QTX03536.1 PLDc N-terminal domain-containing protein [Agromyces archimandritae]